MCQQQRPGLSLVDLPQCGAVKIEEFADAALGVFNLAVYPVSGQVDKAAQRARPARSQTSAALPVSSACLRSVTSRAAA